MTFILKWFYICFFFRALCQDKCQCFHIYFNYCDYWWVVQKKYVITVWHPIITPQKWRLCSYVGDKLKIIVLIIIMIIIIILITMSTVIVDMSGGNNIKVLWFSLTLQVLRTQPQRRQSASLLERVDQSATVFDEYSWVRDSNLWASLSWSTASYLGLFTGTNYIFLWMEREKISSA